MNTQSINAAGLTMIVGLTLSATAQPLADIDPGNRFAWSENAGYVNFGAFPPGSQGPHGPDAVRVLPSQRVARHLAGFAWQENTGWINLGDGMPADGLSYSNLDGEDSGVNVEPNGDLSGLAWAENVGYINFDTRATLTATNQQARLELLPASGPARFRGYAWSPNIGWINLDDADLLVQLRCPADLSSPASPGQPDGVLTGADFFAFLGLFQTGSPQADLSSPTQPGVPDGAFTGADFFEFLTLFSQGCPE